MKHRIHRYLMAHTDGASSREIAENVLKIEGAHEGVCRKLVEAAVAGEPLLTLGADGLWRVAPPESRDIPLSHATFTVIAILCAETRSGKRLPIEISARRVQDGEIRDEFDALISPRSSILPEFSDLTGITNDVLRRAKSMSTVTRSFFRFLGDSVVVLHSQSCPLSGVRQSSSDLLAMLKRESQRLGLEMKNRELCLHRLMRAFRLEWKTRVEAKGVRPGRQGETDGESARESVGERGCESSMPLPLTALKAKADTLHDLASALSIPYEDVRRSSHYADLAAEILIRFLGALEERGLNTLEDALDFQYPEIEEIDFAKYAFDRDFLLQLPEQPGVYVMKNKKGETIYVGKAKNLRDRVRSYFVNAAVREAKIETLLDEVYDIQYEVAGSELAALLMEVKLILERQPKINRQIEVHERPVAYGKGKSLILILPAEVEDCVELFLVSKDRPPIQIEMSASPDSPDYAADLGVVREAIRETYFDEGGEFQVRESVGPSPGAAMEILGSWLARNKDVVNYIAVDDAAGLDEVVRRLEDHIKHSGATGEKVYHV